MLKLIHDDYNKNRPMKFYNLYDDALKRIEQKRIVEIRVNALIL